MDATEPTFYEGVAAIHRLFLNALQEAGAGPIEVGDELLQPAQVIVTTAPETADRWR